MANVSELTKMLEEAFGVKQKTVKTHKVMYGGITYTLRYLGQDDMEKVNALALTPDATNAKIEDRLGAMAGVMDGISPRTWRAIVAVSLCAVNDTPVWRFPMWNTQVEETEKAIGSIGANELEPQPFIRFRIAENLSKWLMPSKNAPLIQHLYNEYAANLDAPTVKEQQEEEKKNEGAEKPENPSQSP